VVENVFLVHAEVVGSHKVVPRFQKFDEAFFRQPVIDLKRLFQWFALVSVRFNLDFWYTAVEATAPDVVIRAAAVAVSE
jgi:hypothetical protein